MSVRETNQHCLCSVCFVGVDLLLKILTAFSCSPRSMMAHRQLSFCQNMMF